MPRISLIIPIYNVEAYLDAALRSVQAQTASDFEVILVNDGSTDSSAEIAATFCALDERFQLVHQDNRGPGPGGGRNGGLATASGELLMFMDSDDVILPTTLDDLATLLGNPELDLATTSTARLAGANIRPSTIHDLSHPHDATQTTARSSPWLMFDSTPWNKMFRREFFDRIVGRWGEQELYEDIVPMTTCHIRARSVGVIAQAQYLWRSRGDGSSITQQRRGIESDLAQLDRLIEADGVVREHGTAEQKRWLDWKAYTFDFVWMLRKLAVLDGETAADLSLALDRAMATLGDDVVPVLTPQLRTSVELVRSGEVGPSRRHAATHRLSMVPDRRRLIEATEYPALDAVLVSAASITDGQRIVMSSPVEHGPPRLHASSEPPWNPAGQVTRFEPVKVRRVGRRIHATFELRRAELPAGALTGQQWYLTAQAGGAQSELRRSLVNRFSGRVRARNDAPLRRHFEDAMLVLGTGDELPRLDAAHSVDASVELSIDIGTAAAASTVLLSSGSGGMEHHYPAEALTSEVRAAFPLDDLKPGIDYFVALADEANPGLIEPVSHGNPAVETTSNGGFLLRYGPGGQAVIRRKDKPTQSILNELRSRDPR